MGTLLRSAHSRTPRALYCLDRELLKNEMINGEMLKTSEENKEECQKSEVDRFQAWLTLACIFITNATTLGSLKIYGLIFQEIVAQNYYNREQASWPISTASTVQNLAGKQLQLYMYIYLVSSILLSRYLSEINFY